MYPEDRGVPVGFSCAAVVPATFTVVKVTSAELIGDTTILLPAGVL